MKLYECEGMLVAVVMGAYFRFLPEKFESVEEYRTCLETVSEVIKLMESYVDGNELATNMLHLLRKIQILFRCSESEERHRPLTDETRDARAAIINAVNHDQVWCKNFVLTFIRIESGKAIMQKALDNSAAGVKDISASSKFKDAVAYLEISLEAAYKNVDDWWNTGNDGRPQTMTSCVIFSIGLQHWHVTGKLCYQI